MPPDTEGDTRGLTTREREVLALLRQGLSNKEIAERLYLSPNTVAEYVGRLLRKFDVSRRTELIAMLRDTPPSPKDGP